MDTIHGTTIDYKAFEPTGFSQTIFKERYAFTPEETWEEACLRVASQMAKAESPEKIKTFEEKFNKILVTNLFVPGGRIWYNSGRNNPQLLNCFVLSNELDSKEGWGNIAKEMIVTSMTGGGCGIDFTDVRPNGSPIFGQKGECPGPVSLMELIDNCASPVKAGGQRRVALMFSLDIQHPDVMEFLDAKLTRGKLTHANVSVKCNNTKEFIKAVKNDGEIELSWKGKFKRKIKAKDLWDKIVKNTYNSAEPGFLNWELMSSENNIAYSTDLVTCNPCGEIGLEKYGNCCLGHIVLSRFVTSDMTDIDWNTLGNTVRTAVRFLDNVLTVNHYPLPEMKDNANKYRRIGLGTTALADMLVLLGLRYGSPEANKFTDKVYRFISKSAYEASVMLAVEKGMFPLCQPDKHIESGFMKRMTSKIRALVLENGIRNCALLTIAPTGCQAPNTLVVSNNGILRLDEMINVDGPQWQEYNHGYGIGVAQEQHNEMATKGFVNGYVDTKKILLNSGIELESTLNHQYRVFDFENRDYVWKRADELTKNDYVAYRIGGYNNSLNATLIPLNEEDYNGNEQKINLPTSIDKDFAELLGMIYADGSVHHKGIRIHIDFEDVELIEHFSKLIKKVLHIEPNIDLNEKNTCATICINSTIFNKFLTKNKILKEKALEISIPRKIRESSNEIILSFLNGFWLGDGSQSGSSFYYDTGSKQMAQDIAVCLRALGINSYIRFYDKSKDAAAYGNNKIYRVYKKGFGSKGFEKQRYIKREDKIKKIICEEFGEELFFDKVENIENSKNMTLDIEVPKNNTYLGNSVVSHNTVSILSDNCSSGIEPMFAPAYERRFWKDNKREIELVFHPLFAKFLDSERDVSNFVGSYELTVKEHMEVQKIIQKHIDNAVSKTINMPEDYSMEDMSEIWLEYLPYLKGTTFYRQNTRGYVDADGVVHEPPLMALSLEASMKIYHKEKDKILRESEDHCYIGPKKTINKGSEVDCSSGVCEL